MRKTIVAFSLLCSTILLPKVSPLTVEAEEGVLSSNESAQFLCDNFIDFKNSLSENQQFDGSFCDHTTPVFTADGEELTLIDFDGNNGHILMGSNLNSYDLQTIGDLHITNDQPERIIFSNGIYYGEDERVNDIAVFASSNLQTPFLGQVFSGSGGIESPNSYVIDRYDSHYLLEKYKTFYIQPTNQNSFNVYNSPSGNGEGNCTLNASYIALNYIAKETFTGMKNTINTFTPSTMESDLYDTYVTERNYTTASTNYSFPQLFIELRLAAVNRGYTPDGGLNIWNTSGILEDVASNNGYALNGVELIDYTPNFSTVINQVNLKKPMLWSTLTDETYGSHVMVVNGYRQYHKTETIWLVTVHSYVNLLAIYDGWSIKQRYFDLTSYAKGYNWGALVRFDYEQ